MKFDFAANGGVFLEAIVTTRYIVSVALGTGGLAGLGLGVLLFITRKGGLRPNAVVFNILNVLLNFFRPIQNKKYLAAMEPLTLKVVGSRIGTNAFI